MVGNMVGLKKWAGVRFIFIDIICGRVGKGDNCPGMSVTAPSLSPILFAYSIWRTVGKPGVIQPDQSPILDVTIFRILLNPG